VSLPSSATKGRSPSSAPVAPNGIALRVALVQEGTVRWERVLDGGAWSLVDGALERAARTEIVLSVADGRVELLRGEGRIRRADGAVAHAVGPVTLGLGDHARWTVDGSALLVQAIEPPPRRPRPGLPAALRGSHVVDGRFTAIAAASLLAHFALVVVLENMDPPYVAAATLSPRVVEMMMDAPVPPPDAPPELAEADEATEAPTEVAEADDGEATSRPSGPRGPARPRPAPSSDEIARMVAEGTAGLSGGVISALGETTLAGATTRAGAILAGMDGAPSVSSGGPVLAPRSGGGRAPTGGLGELALAGGTGEMRSEGSTLEAAGPVGVVRPSSLIEDPSPGWLDPTIVTRAIRSRTAAIRRCYERELRDQPTLAGSLDVAFTIEATGEVTGVRLADDTIGSDRLERCVLDVVRSIRRIGAQPEGGAVRYVYPIVFVPGA
jgi:TonB family protein